MSRIRAGAAVSLLALTLACATTSTRLAQIAPEEVAAEEHKQRELALLTLHHQQVRLDSIAFPLLVGGATLCEEATRGLAGVRYANAFSYDETWRPAARSILGLGDSVEIVSVTPNSPAARAGLEPGDRILALNMVPTATGADGLEQLNGMLADEAAARMDHWSVSFLRDSVGVGTATVELVTGCAYPATVIADGALNAYADGKAVFITSSMMRFAEDDELRVVIGHEIAHNAMKHINAKKKNAFWGALLGVVGDIAMAGAGYNTGGYYTSMGASMGAQTFSQSFEREADYVGLYILAAAGYDLTGAPTFWRHMAQANPESIGLAFSHPTSAERFVRMEKAIEEIRAKQEAGVELRPEMKEAKKR